MNKNKVGHVLEGIIAVAFFFIITLSDAYPAHTALDEGVHFTDATSLLGNLDYTRTWGISWADYDGDGWVDVFLNNHVNRPTLLRNNGGTFFEDHTNIAGVNVKADHHNCHWADYDNDGDLDLFCTTGARRGTGSVPANFWRNNGDGTFTDIADSMETTHGTARGRSVSWLDIDGDGDLDLFVGTAVRQSSDPVSILYRNDGNVFTDITAQAGFYLPGTVAQSTVFDYNGDGNWDLLLQYQAFDEANSPCTRCIFVMQNDGQGNFTALNGNVTGIDAQFFQTMSLGDYDNDGYVDLFVAGSGPGTKRLYRNNGNGAFSRVSINVAGLSAILNEPVKQTIWADFDNDGYLDLFFVISDDGVNRPNRLFFGNGDGTFRDGTTQAGIQGTNAGSSDVAAIADFNNDGFLDILIGNGAGEIAGPYQLFRNEGNSNHWLRVRLNGSMSATSLGSKIWISVNGQIQYREYVNHNDKHAFHEPIAHFGLGAATTIDWVRVRWPDGTITQLNDLQVDQLLTLSFDDSADNLTTLPTTARRPVSIRASADGVSFTEDDR